MKTSIVIIDDDEAVRDALEIVLGAAGYAVFVANEGAAGVALCREHKPKLVLTDIVMAGQEGIETIMLLRQEFPDVVIIAMSGGGRLQSTDYLRLAEKFGAHMTLEKPFDVDRLLSLVSDAAA